MIVHLNIFCNLNFQMEKEHLQNFDSAYSFLHVTVLFVGIRLQICSECATKRVNSDQFHQ